MEENKNLVLIYHDVFDQQLDASIPHSAAMYHISKDQFKEHIYIVRHSAIEVISIEKYLNGKGNSSSMIFTFDDGWAGVYNTAYPLFNILGWSVALFITSDFIGRPGFLSEQQLIELSNAGFELGVHGTTHRMLSGCTTDEIYWELSTCKKYLEDLTGKNIKYGSLPGGDETPEIISIASQVGLQALFTSKPGINTGFTSPYALQRVCVRSSTSSGDMERYCKFSIKQEIFRSAVLQLPHRLLGGKNYALFRRWLLREKQGSASELFTP